MPVTPGHTLWTRMVRTSLPFCPGACASNSLSLCRGGSPAPAPPPTCISVPRHVFLPSIPCIAAWPGEAEELWGHLANHISRKVQLINLSFCCYSWGEAGLGEMQNFHKPRSAKLGQMLSTLWKCSWAILYSLMLTLNCHHRPQMPGLLFPINPYVPALTLCKSLCTIFHMHFPSLIITQQTVTPL